MLDLGNLRFPDVNKAFLKGIFWLLVFLFLATIFISARGIYDRFLQKPELRFNIIPIANDLYEENIVWIQRAVIVENQGNADASNVIITSFMPSGAIDRIDIYSDEQYTLESSENKSSESIIKLTRLAQGASTRLFIWGYHLTNIYGVVEQPKLQIYVTYDGGVAEPRGTPTALEEIKNLGDLVGSGFQAIYQRFNNEIGLTFLLQAIYASLPTLGIYDVSFEPMPEDFKAAFISLLIVSVCIWLLLRKEWAGFIIAVLIGFLLWLYTDFTVNIVWLAISTFIATIAALITESNKEATILIIVMFISFTILMSYTWLDQWTCINYPPSTVTQILNCVPVRIPGGIVVGFFVISIYTFIVEI